MRTIRFFTRLLPAITYLLALLPVLKRLWGNSFFLFELFTHFPLQLAVVSGMAAGYWAGRKRPLLCLLGLGSLASHALAVYFAIYQPVEPSVPKDHPADLRVYHANVLYTRDDYRPIIDTIRHLKPDFFVLQEMTPEGVRAVSALRREYPYQDSVWAKGPCYILVGSRTPFTVDSAARRNYRAIALTSTVRGRVVSLVTVHPRTPLLPSWFRERNRQLQFVGEWIRRSKLPTVLIGDFNISPFSPVFDRTLGNSSRLRACRRGFGYTPTWPRFLPLLFIPIDHAFTNFDFRTSNFRPLTTPGSDHRAVCVDLVYRQNSLTALGVNR